ncbi:MAG: cell division protein FtsQ/DivIB [Solirubrobacteraceae bacterium]|nr:cell division protein FtsQ/DivIB [Solirubrobacteraceae bacterium]
MHAPASLTGAGRRLLKVPVQLRRKPGVPGGRPAAVAAACIAGLLLFLALILVYTPIAHPKTLVVSGVTGSSEARITRLLEETGAKQSTFAVDHDALMRAVRAYPEVAAVEVASHPPFRLEIHAVMRPPVGRIEIGGRAFVVAADGTILQRAANADVPKLDETVGDVAVKDGHISGARATLQVLAAAPEALLAVARTVRVGHAGVEIEMSRGPRLVFGSGEQAADKWAAAAAVIADGSADAATYIDLRVPARPAVGGLGGSKTAASTDPPILTNAAPINGDPDAAAAPSTGTVAPATGTGTTGTGTGTGTTGATGTGTTGTGAGTTVMPQAGTTTGATGTGTGTDATGTGSAGTDAGTAGTATGTTGTGGAAIAPAP